MEVNDDNRLQEFRQLKNEIRGSTHHLVVGMDIAKDNHTAFFGTPAGKTLLRRFVFDNTKEGFEKLTFQAGILKTQQSLSKLVRATPALPTQFQRASPKTNAFFATDKSGQERMNAG